LLVVVGNSIRGRRRRRRPRRRWGRSGAQQRDERRFIHGMDVTVLVGAGATVAGIA
jgi:hypothetical protein